MLHLFWIRTLSINMLIIMAIFSSAVKQFFICPALRVVWDADHYQKTLATFFNPPNFLVYSEQWRCLCCWSAGLMLLLPCLVNADLLLLCVLTASLLLAAERFFAIPATPSTLCFYHVLVGSALHSWNVCPADLFQGMNRLSLLQPYIMLNKLMLSMHSCLTELQTI